MPRKNKKTVSATTNKSDWSVAIKFDYSESTLDDPAMLVRVRAVEFDDKSINKDNRFDEKISPFTAELAAKFAAYIGNRKTYGDSPYARHMWNNASRFFEITPPDTSVYAYDYYKHLHPSESKEHRGQHPLSVIVKKYPTGKLEGAEQLATTIMLMRKAISEKGISPDTIDADALARKAKASAKKKPTKVVDEKDAAHDVKASTVLTKRALASNEAEENNAPPKKKVKTTSDSKAKAAVASTLVSMSMFKSKPSTAPSVSASKSHRKHAGM
jgi:hypothetical protein